MENNIKIEYCTQCGWLLRATWMSQELLTTFTEEITTLALKPGTGGIFNISANDKIIWSRKEQGRFPDITELKRVVRDHIAPERNQGHIDRKKE